jgi:hypothetical protein
MTVYTADRPDCAGCISSSWLSHGMMPSIAALVELHEILGELYSSQLPALPFHLGLLIPDMQGPPR